MPPHSPAGAPRESTAIDRASPPAGFLRELTDVLEHHPGAALFMLTGALVSGLLGISFFLGSAIN